MVEKLRSVLNTNMDKSRNVSVLTSLLLSKAVVLLHQPNRFSLCCSNYISLCTYLVDFSQFIQVSPQTFPLKPCQLVTIWPTIFTLYGISHLQNLQLRVLWVLFLLSTSYNIYSIKESKMSYLLNIVPQAHRTNLVALFVCFVQEVELMSSCLQSRHIRH